jgi:hypothetical protein
MTLTICIVASHLIVSAVSRETVALKCIESEQASQVRIAPALDPPINHELAKLKIKSMKQRGVGK